MQNQTKVNYFTIIISAIFPLLGFWQMNIMNVLGGIIGSELNQVQISWLSASYIYADGLCLIPVGLLLDCYSTKHIILLGMVIFNLGLLVFALANNFYTMCFARIIIGSGHAFALMCCFRLINTLIPGNRQASWISNVLMIAFCGGLLAQTPSLIIIGYTGWHSLIWLSLGLSCVIGLILLFSLEYYPQIKQANLLKNKLYKIVQVALNHKNWQCAIFISAMDIPVMLLGSMFGIQFLQNKHLTAGVGSTVTATIYLGTIAGSLFFGYLFDRVRYKQLIILMASFIVFSLLASATFIDSGSYMTFVIIFSLCGFFSSIQSIGYAKVANFNSAEVTSVAMSLVNVLLMLIIASLQIVFSHLYSNLAIRAFYILALLIMFGGVVGALLCNSGLKREYL